MVQIGNDNSNSFWEKHHTKECLPADVEREIREPYIRAKYEMKSWIPRRTGESKEMLSQLLCIAVENGDLMRTIELLAHGADVREGGGWEGVKEQRREGEFLVDSFILFFFFLLLPPPFALSLSLSLSPSRSVMSFLRKLILN